MKNVHKHIQGCNLKKVKNCLDRGVHLIFSIATFVVEIRFKICSEENKLYSRLKKILINAISAD